MRLNILPRKERFFQYFEEQAEIICESARLLKDLVDNYMDVEAKVNRLTDLEHKGDELIHEVAVRLNKTFITPMDREDIHALSNYLDDILDYGSATRLHYFKVEKTTPAARKMADVIVHATEVVRSGIKQLPAFKDICKLLVDIKELEREGDRINRTAVAELFEQHADPLEVIKWKEIYQSMETATDKCEDAVDVLEGIVLKHS